MGRLVHRIVIVVNVVGLLAGAFACAPPPRCEVQTPLVTGEDWQLVPPTTDTTWPAPDGAALCGDDDIQRQVFDDVVAVEIDTRFGCGHATVSQPILAPLRAGDEVQVRVFYFSQTAFPAAEAAVAVVVGDESVLDARVAIPTTSGLLTRRVAVSRDHPAGTAAQFHVGNHGDNSWNLVELSQIALADCAAAAD